MAWKDVRGLAPGLVDNGKKLWARVSSRRAPLPPSTFDSASVAEVRLRVLEQRVAVLEEEAVASFDVVRSITQQHSQLAEQHAEMVQATDALLAHTRVLMWAGAGVALALGVLLAAAIAR
jgi:hypothetical protein